MVLENINRLEVIDHTRDFTKGESARAFQKFLADMMIEIVTQDDGKTVKIFISPQNTLDKSGKV